MPIRPEFRKFYGRQWRAYRLVLLELAANRCTKCGATHPVLNCAPVHHDPRDGQLVTVWCPSCHAKHDAPHAYAIRRRTLARRAGQLWLFPEIEWAPFASWMVPRRVLIEAQTKLFEEEEPMRVKLKRKSKKILSVTFHADTDEEAVALKEAVLVAAAEGFAPGRVLEELGKAGYEPEGEEKP